MKPVIRDKLIENAKVTTIDSDETYELPQRGLGDDYINEIYELDAPSSFSRSKRLMGIRFVCFDI